MTPGMPLFSPMMPYGSGLTPQPVQNTNSLSILEEQQRQQQAQQQQQQAQQQAQQASSGTPQAVIFFIFHIYYEKSWFYLAVVEVNLRLHINNHLFFFFSPSQGHQGRPLNFSTPRQWEARPQLHCQETPPSLPPR